MQTLRALYNKLTYEWPLAFSDRLYAMLVIAPAKFLNELTFKRAILLVGLAIAVVGLAQMMPGPEAYLAAVDLMSYIDVASAVLLIAALARARAILAYTKALARTAIPHAREFAAGLRRYAARARRIRVRSLVSRKTADDEPPAAAWAFA